MSTYTVTARAKSPPSIQQWDFIYLRTAPLAASEMQANGRSLTSVKKGFNIVFSSLIPAKYKHWGLQIRHCVYDLSRGNDDMNDHEDRSPVYYPKTVSEWELIHSGHTKKAVGITFLSNYTIDKSAFFIWSSNYREDYVLTSQNCQHFNIQLLYSIHPTAEELALIPSNVLAALVPLPSPFRTDKVTADIMPQIRTRSVEHSDVRRRFLTQDKPYYGYRKDLVNRYVSMGYTVETVTILLQRLGVAPLSFGIVSQPSSITPEVEEKLLYALDGRNKIDEQGNVT
ncbi:hypothetical protein DE146DRAFT_784746 [Phaeosphaeria sp. MPI-PUGE-AT-0046c]|nr:hypothetical protein DE146DRAFT_784746 [Phaeosphaeria sp. MPI-PUGE-AT-0046c]